MKSKVYEGSEPYVFISYSHKDRESVLEIINDLMLCACNLWYDTGIRSGEDWNREIAEHLFNADCVLVMITKNSIESEYVKDELNFAKSKNKKIYPVFLENLTLPLSLDLLLSRTQAITCFNNEVNKNRFRIREEIKNNLPESVFKTIEDPFYIGDNNSFYLKNTSYVFPNGTYFAGEEHNSFEINIVNSESGCTNQIYFFQAAPGYDMKYSLNKASIFDDPYFCDEDSAVLFISMVLSFCSKYPTNWPDFDIVLTISISRIESLLPRLALVDYKCIGEFSESERSFINNIIAEIEKSFSDK